jgi:SAM-dependent methyltransferase
MYKYIATAAQKIYHDEIRGRSIKDGSLAEGIAIIITIMYFRFFVKEYFHGVLQRAGKHVIKSETDMARPLEQPKNRKKVLATNVIRLSRLFTREREHLPASYLKDAQLREAYLAYFLPANSGKIRMPLAELALHPEQAYVNETIRVLDLGSGPGTALLGVMEYFASQQKKHALECVAVDQVAENLALAVELFHDKRRSLGLSASLETISAGIEKTGQHLSASFDLIIISNVLNELFAHQDRFIEKRLDMLEKFVMSSLSEHGACIIIDPALRETSRDLLQVRDGLVKRGFTIYAPCLFSNGCPALANPRDWCHQDLPWEPTSQIKEVDKLTGLRKDSLKFSYLVVRKDGRSLADIYDEKCFRVVSEPLISKGKIEFFLCGQGSRRLTVRFDKDETPVNEPLRMLRRGDVARFDPLITENARYKVGKETGIVIKKSP